MRFASAVLLCASVAIGCGGSTAGTRLEPAVHDPETLRQARDQFVETYELGLRLQRDGKCEDALREGFEPALRAYRRGFPDGPFVGERSSAGAAEHAIEAVDYGDVLYLAAFCEIELERMDAAERHLRAALEVVVDDPLYACELGHVQQARDDFDGSLATFTRAAERARELEQSTPTILLLGHSLRDLRHRALRGVGYSLIALGRLEDASEIFREVLAENPSDERSIAELQYIEQLRSGQVAPQ